jgi:hypothetical protein
MSKRLLWLAPLAALVLIAGCDSADNAIDLSSAMSVDSAKVVPIGEVGEAGFWWDADRLHIVLENSRDRTYLPLGPDESVCVSLHAVDLRHDTERAFVIYVQGAILPSDPPARSQSFLRLHPVLGQLPSPELIRIEHAAWPGASAPEHPWRVNLALEWDALTNDGRPPNNLRIHVYRVTRERPFAELKLHRAH